MRSPRPGADPIGERSAATARPALVVLSTLFPSTSQPLAGVFIKERMFRVARHLPLAVVSPQPWFPLQGLVRRWRPGYRPERPRFEQLDGTDVYRPRFLALPAIGRRFDGFMIALAARYTLRRLQRQGRADLIDAHFAYPDGYAASLLGGWLCLPFTVTLRGTEVRHAAIPSHRARMERTLRSAARIFAVSDSLRSVALDLGAPPSRAMVIGNGIDLARFHPMDRHEARSQLQLPPDAPVLVSVGGLVERKGFHRVIACMPELLQAFPDLMLLVVGGPSPEGDWSERLRAQVQQLGLERHVRFLGALAPDELRGPLSAADVFVLATSNEGWANVFLEAMACGLPVVTTRVGGNAEVVANDDVGTLVPFGEPTSLRDAIADALRKPWNRATILRYAADNTWDTRIDKLMREFAAASDPGLSAEGGDRRER